MNQERLYYIQNKGFSGDCLLWWRMNRCGYTCNLNEALRVDKLEADSICGNRPEQDFAWPVEEVDQAAGRHANSEQAYFATGLRERAATVREIRAEQRKTAGGAR